MYLRDLRAASQGSTSGVPQGSHSAVNVVGYDWLPTFAGLAGAAAHVEAERDVIGICGHKLVVVIKGSDPDMFVLFRLYKSEGYESALEFDISIHWMSV